MHVLLRITPKQEIILRKRLGLTPTLRDEETDMSIFEIDQNRKSWRLQLRELEQYGGKSLKLTL